MVKRVWQRQRQRQRKKMRIATPAPSHPIVKMVTHDWLSETTKTFFFFFFFLSSKDHREFVKWRIRNAIYIAFGAHLDIEINDL